MKYEFKSTGDKKIDSIVKQFDKQIKKEYKNAEIKRDAHHIGTNFFS